MMSSENFLNHNNTASVAVLFGPRLVDPTGIEPVFTGVNSVEVDHYLHGPIHAPGINKKLPTRKREREFFITPA